jgi:hypothetical protein
MPAWLQHLDQVSEREQIGHPERGSPGGDDHKRIVRDYVGPTGRDLPQPAGVIVEIDAMASKTVAVLIPAIVNGHSGHRDHRFRASRSLIGAKRRRQLVP